MVPYFVKRFKSVYSSTVGCRFPTYNRSLSSSFLELFSLSFCVAVGICSEDVDSGSSVGKDRNRVLLLLLSLLSLLVDAVVVAIGSGEEVVRRSTTWAEVVTGRFVDRGYEEIL
jgi:hypothetical protein